MENVKSFREQIFSAQVILESVETLQGYIVGENDVYIDIRVRRPRSSRYEIRRVLRQDCVSIYRNDDPTATLLLKPRPYVYETIPNVTAELIRNDKFYLLTGVDGSVTEIQTQFVNLVTDPIQSKPAKGSTKLPYFINRGNAPSVSVDDDIFDTELQEEDDAILSNIASKDFKDAPAYEPPKSNEKLTSLDTGFDTPVMKKDEDLDANW